MEVKIGPIKYEVVLVSRLHDGNKDLFGEAKHGLCEIRLEADNAPQQIRQTLWHEIFHLVLYQLGRSGQQDDEDLIEGLAHALMQVVQDNPWLAEEAE